MTNELTQYHIDRITRTEAARDNLRATYMQHALEHPILAKALDNAIDQISIMLGCYAAATGVTTRSTTP